MFAFNQGTVPLQNFAGLFTIEMILKTLLSIIFNQQRFDLSYLGVR